MRRIPCWVGTLLLSASLLASNALASGFQSVDSIRAAALQALPAGSDAAATLDANLRLPACASALSARVNGSQSVEVSCPQDAGWRLFVPVRVRRNQTVLVLNRGIGAGQLINATDFTTETRDAARLVGAAIADPAQAIGQIARRTLSAGSVLSPGDLAAPRLIRRGDNVALVSRRGGAEVRMNGKALGDAGENERVMVENFSSRRVIQGRVGADGEVWVSR